MTQPFGRTQHGKPAALFTLENARLRVKITNFGARLVSVEAPDRRGNFDHVVLGFDDAAAYIAAGGSFGAILGRYANRIGKGSFMLDGQAYRLAVNANGNTLHGGPSGFSNALWAVAGCSDGPAPELSLSLVSPNGDQGFPGELTVNASYRLLGDDLRLELTATTDRPTIVNLSSHPYFNLAGVAGQDCLSHEITIAAGQYLPTDDQQIPTGVPAAVAGTVFDFRNPRRIGARIREADTQLLIGRGYDHCFVVDQAGAADARLAARARDPVSGRTVEVRTTQPGLQFYSGNSLNGSVIGRGGIAYRQSAGFALEAQNFPDAPNQARFPSAVLRPGETYRQIIDYRFRAD